MTTRPLRVIVAGTTFGQVYLEGLHKPNPVFELAGLLATGSERSRACARHYGIPLFTATDQMPQSIDVACVVVRGAVLGGRGSELARQLMQRGIHVLQEQPLHHDEVAESLRAARRDHVRFEASAFYSRLPEVRRFIDVARRLLSSRPAAYIDAACGLQVSYALFEIIRDVLGKLRPWRFRATSEATGAAPFRSLEGSFGGIPISLRIQNQLHPSDPDYFPYLLHRITLGTDAGELTLASTHGPVLWNPRPELPRDVKDAGGHSLFAHDTAHVPEAVSLGPQSQAGHAALFRTVWPTAARSAVEKFCAAIESGTSPVQRAQQQLTLCQMWQDVVGLIGRPDLIGGTEPFQPLTAVELDSMRSAAQQGVDPAAELQDTARPVTAPIECEARPVGAEAFAASSRSDPNRSGIRELLAMISLAGPWAIRVAATLRLADRMTSGSRDVNELASAVGADADALERLLGFLSSRGIFASREPGRFELNAAARLLRDDSPAGLRGWLDLDGAGGRLDAAWPGLLQSIRTGGPGDPGTHGGIWSEIARDADIAHSFNTLMASATMRSAGDVIGGFDWNKASFVVDVGGGAGVLLGKILDAFPHVRGSLIELPHVAQSAQSHLATRDLSHRCDVVGGNCLDFVPVDADVYLLANVLHDWGDKDAATILRRCREAMHPRGRVVIAERIRGNDNLRASTEDDLRFLTLFGGRVRSLDQVCGLAAEAQLVLASTRRMPSGISVIELATTQQGKEVRS